MKIYRSLEPIETSKPAVVMAVGFFDGVHRGHQQVVELCHTQAHALHAESWVMTFDPHPLQVVQPSAAPLLLTSLEAKLGLLEKHNLDGCVVVPFTREFSQMEPAAFLEHLVLHVPGLRGMVIGDNWRFGRNAGGTVETLRTLAKSHPFSVHVAPPLAHKGETISSTRIRDCIACGKLDEAAAMLGRPHRVGGRVTDGLKRGRKLGFPTANLQLDGFALPPSGIYAANVNLQNQIHPGAVYLPSNPAQRGLVEVHLIDFHGNLYGKDLTVDFIRKVREDNLRFDREPDLVRQIQSDVDAIRKIVSA